MEGLTWSASLGLLTLIGVPYLNLVALATFGNLRFLDLSLSSNNVDIIEVCVSFTKDEIARGDGGPDLVGISMPSYFHWSPISLPSCLSNI